jgi:nucleoside-diphosphate-sugar epimerase
MQALHSLNARYEEFHLGEPVPPKAFEGIDTIIHAAWDLRDARSPEAWKRNVVGSRYLISAAESSNTRVIFISSMSAYEKTKQPYGLAKLAVERSVIAAGGIVLRLGLVYGARAGGMLGSLRSMASLPVEVGIWGAKWQYLVHEDDMVRAVLLLVGSSEYEGAIAGVAAADPVSFGQLMAELRVAPPRARLMVPWYLIYAVLRAGELLHIGVPFRSDSLLGLVNPAPGLPDTDLTHALRPLFRARDLGATAGD